MKGLNFHRTVAQQNSDATVMFIWRLKQAKRLIFTFSINGSFRPGRQDYRIGFI